MVDQKNQLKVTLVRSTIGFNRNQAAVVRGLGLRRLHTVTVRHAGDARDDPQGAASRDGGRAGLTQNGLEAGWVAGADRAGGDEVPSARQAPAPSLQPA